MRIVIVVQWHFRKVNLSTVEIGYHHRLGKKRIETHFGVTFDQRCHRYAVGACLSETNCRRRDTLRVG